MADIINGKEISDSIRTEIADRVEKLSKVGIIPGLAVILAGDDPASHVYVRMKEKACEKTGIYSVTKRMPETVTQDEIEKYVLEFNNDPKIHGILVQHPLPYGIDEPYIFSLIDPNKDVDGFHPVNVGKLLIGQECFAPCTPLGIMELLHRSGNPPSGKNVTVLGRSTIVGKPISALLIQKNKSANATVTICHSGTKNIGEITKEADILIAAIGVPEFVTGEMVKEGAVVIDVGVNRVDDPSKEKGYRLAGDVKFSEVEPKVKAITPVPGGVGPMTITMLLHNTTLSAENAVKT
ncbi:bifunctional methylenetetrahydrofolate dehydrogenase/methenyltetrahydrofolate cyclohydrolase FolD [candidate division KSB1 bacterium]